VCVSNSEDNGGSVDEVCCTFLQR